MFTDLNTVFINALRCISLVGFGPTEIHEACLGHELNEMNATY